MNLLTVQFPVSASEDVSVLNFSKKEKSLGAAKEVTRSASREPAKKEKSKEATA